MKYLILLLSCIGIAPGTIANIPQPLIIESPATLKQARNLKASSDARQWIAAFSKLRPGTSNKIEIITAKDGEVLTISNIYELEISPDYRADQERVEGNLLIATQRVGNRDFRIVIDPRQIRYIRETQP